MGWWGGLKKEQLIPFHLPTEQYIQGRIQKQHLNLLVSGFFTGQGIPLCSVCERESLCVHSHACELLFTKHRCQSITCILGGGESVVSCRRAGVMCCNQLQCKVENQVICEMGVFSSNHKIEVLGRSIVL